jgi:hypothetical protein
MLVIGLGATAQVGKDTAATYLEKKYPGRFKRVAFADKLKQITMDLFGLSWEQCYGPQEIKEAIDPRYGKSPRKIMQEVGEKMREIYPDIWVDTVFHTTIPKHEKEGYDCFAASDMRYPNEADGIRRRFGFAVRVDRDGVGVEVGKEHSSETALKDYKYFDFTIDNNGSFEEFYTRVDEMMEKIVEIMEEHGYGGAQGEDNH